MSVRDQSSSKVRNTVRNKVYSKVLLLSSASLMAAVSFGGLTRNARAESAKLPPRPRQFIMISFDGSETIGMWQATREHGVKNNARYTHFVSATDFLVGSERGPIEGETKKLYTPPRFDGRLRSNIGFGGNRAVLARRLNQVKQSILAGMEIASHAVGHFDGTAWSQEEWTYEFNRFHEFLYHVYPIHNLTAADKVPSQSEWQELIGNQMLGIRTPYLGTGEGFFETLAQESWPVSVPESLLEKHQSGERNIDDGHVFGQYLYDASTTSARLSDWPKKDPRGFWRFPLVTIPVPGRAKRVLSMDYNFYEVQSKATPDPANANLYEEQMYQAYINWFLLNYHGNRAPLNIGHHFSTWNDGAYWRALQRFVETVCNLEEVACVSYAEMVTFLEGTDEEPALQPYLSQWQRGEFDQRQRPRVEIPVRMTVKDGGADGTINGLVVNGRIARLPSESFSWKIDGAKTALAELDLVKLAKHGITDITLVTGGEKGPVEMPLFIDWNTSNDTAKLRYLEPASGERCPPDAHKEKVDEKFLGRKRPLEL